MVSLFINILITSIIYLLLPIVFFILKREISKKNRIIICAIYCAIVCLIIQIIKYNMIVNYKIKFTTGLFYYFILTSIISTIPTNDKTKKNRYGHNNKNNNLEKCSTSNICIRIFIIISLIITILLIVVSIFSKNNDNNHKKSKRENKNDTEITTQNQEPCSYYPIEGNYNIIISAESSSGVGDVFSKMDSNLEFRIHDNNYGDTYVSKRKYQGDQTRYECNEVWYEVYLQNGKHGFVWAGYNGMYIREQ